MISKVLSVISSELNAFLRQKWEADQNSQLVDVADLAQTMPPEARTNQVLCTLINIEQEPVNINSPAGKYPYKNPPVNLNLYVLFSASFQPKNYKEGLAYLSAVISFFQGKQVFTPKNTPRLPSNIDKLTVELANMDLRELSHFWGSLGAQQLPSVLYKFRTLSISEDLILEELPEITGVEIRKEK